MTVYYDKNRKGYRYDFVRFGVRHIYPRTFTTKAKARKAENVLRVQLDDEAAGISPRVRPLSPRFSEIAGEYYSFLVDRNRIDDVETVDRMHRVILRFFGAKPADPAKAKPGSPYLDLRLQDVIDDPSLILRFESWMANKRIGKKKGIAGSTKNRYRSAVSRLYWFAMLPENRARTGITSNPFRGILRDDEFGRDVTVDSAQIRRILLHAPIYLRIAVTIAALAPKLRMGNIFALRWDKNFDAALTQIRVRNHKTRRKTKRMLVSPISTELRLILRAHKDQQPAKIKYVVSYRGKPIGNVIAALRTACEKADVVYGRAADGMTFHTIRHSAATMLTEMGVPDGLLKDVLGHLAIETTQGYKHRNPLHERAPLEDLAKQMPLHDVVFAPRLTGKAAPKRSGNRGGKVSGKRGAKRSKGTTRKTARANAVS